MVAKKSLDEIKGGDLKHFCCNELWSNSNIIQVREIGDYKMDRDSIIRHAIKRPHLQKPETKINCKAWDKHSHFLVAKNSEIATSRSYSNQHKENRRIMLKDKLTREWASQLMESRCQEKKQGKVCSSGKIPLVKSRVYESGRCQSESKKLLYEKYPKLKELISDCEKLSKQNDKDLV